MQQKNQIEKYLEQKVNPILQEMLTNIIKNRPKNVLNYCRTWLDKKADNIQMFPQQSDSSQDEDDAAVQQLLSRKGKNKWYQHRKGICGNVYGNHNLWQEQEVPIVSKKSTVNSRILFRIKSIFLFKQFGDADINLLISAMSECAWEKGSFVVKEGEYGSDMFVIDTGEVQILKASKGGQLLIKTLKEGDIFGQMSMLYNVPRWASIRAKTNCTLFKLNRKQYHHIVNQRNLIRRKLFQVALGKLDCFKQLQLQERFKLEDIASETPIHQNQYVIRQGKHNKSFYIVESGKFVSLRKEKSGHDVIVGNFKQGDIFGQNCLFSKQPPTDSVMSLTNGKIYCIDRDGLQRVLGPISKIIKRSIEIYEKYKNFNEK